MSPHLLFPVAVLALSAPALGQEKPALKPEQVRADYQKALARLEERFATIRGSGTRTRVRLAGQADQRVSESAVRFARKPGLYRAVSTSLKAANGQTPAEAAEFFNKTMSAELQKKANAGMFTVIATGGPGVKEQVWTSRGMRDFLDAPFALAGPVVSEYLADPDFAITGVEEIKRDSKTLLKLSFKRTLKAIAVRPGLLIKRIEDGWLLVSPNESWILYEAELGFREQNGHRADAARHISVTYLAGRTGFPIPKRVEIASVARPRGERKEIRDDRGHVSHDGDIMSSESFEFDEIQFEAAPDDDFTLAGFGLVQILPVDQQRALPPGRLGRPPGAPR